MPSRCACSPGANPSASPSAAPAAVLLEVTSEGGFINASASLAALPTVVVYADGRVLTPGTPPARASDVLVQQISVRDVGPGGAAAILAAIMTTGLADFGIPAVPDHGVTGLRSVVVLGEDAQALAPVVAAATTATPFTSGGASFTLWVRPLLPHELPG